MGILKEFEKYDVVIISYEKLRNDIEEIKKCKIFYLVLDEAHIIKNAHSKISQAVKSLSASKKLILTGTPL